MVWQQPTHDSLKAYFARSANPGKSWCFRCGMPWGTVKHHATRYNKYSACFPLCEGCWELLGSPEARIEYYKILIDHWESDGVVSEKDKRDIQRAVANGG